MFSSVYAIVKFKTQVLVVEKKFAEVKCHIQENQKLTEALSNLQLFFCNKLLIAINDPHLTKH